MELYEGLLTEDWLLGTGLAPAFYESEPITDDGPIKPCLQDGSNSGEDLLAKSIEDEGLGTDFDWLDNSIDFNLLESLGVEGLKEEPTTVPQVKHHGEHLSEFQNAAIDLLESLMVENNSEPEVSFTTLTPRTVPNSQPLESITDSVLSDLTVSVDPVIIPPNASVLPDGGFISPHWDGSCPMSPDEVDSLLSSPPVSPDDSVNSSDSEWLPYEQPKKSRSHKPYSRPSEKAEVTVAPRVKGFDPKTKKERKKVQNKNAATKYRQKKKTEAGHVANEFTVLTDRNTELKQKVDELEHEIAYMKGILKDIYDVKGLITH